MPRSDEPVFARRGVSKPLIGVALGVVLAVGGWFVWHGMQPKSPPAAAQAPPAAAAMPLGEAEASIQHPLPPPADATRTALPDLNDSDGALITALREAAGNDEALALLVPDSLIRHIVVTIDNLPRQKVALDKRPITPAAGAFIADGDELHATIDERNFARYAPWVRALQVLDMQRVGAVYVRFYALFQKAYQDLGYPNGYFNDRLIQVIDLLLATPQTAAPIELTRPNVMYVYADPALESRAAGQKLLIRMGPDNVSAVKTKLVELRAFLTAMPSKR